MTSLAPQQHQTQRAAQQQVFCKVTFPSLLNTFQKLQCFRVNLSKQLTGNHVLAATRWNKYRTLGPDRLSELFCGLATYQPLPQVHAALSISQIDIESLESVVVLTPCLVPSTSSSSGKSSSNSSDSDVSAQSNYTTSPGEKGEEQDMETKPDPSSIITSQLSPFSDILAAMTDRYLTSGQAHIKAFRDIHPSNLKTQGGHTFYTTSDGVYISVDNFDNIVIWQAAYDIFRIANPGVGDYELWSLLRSSSPNSTFSDRTEDEGSKVENGEVDRAPWIQGQTSQGYYSTTACLWEESWWRDIMRKKSLTTEEYAKAWLGEKGLWAFTSPESFPINRAYALSAAGSIASSKSTTIAADASLARSLLENLPLDIFFLLSTHLPLSSLLSLTTATSKTLFTLLTPHLDSLVHASTNAQQPWILPKTSANLYMPEVRENSNFPWLAYSKACRQSPNMKCRQRIWEVVMQLGSHLRPC